MSDASKRASALRSQRLAAARAKGRHKREQWEVLADVIGECVQCGVTYDLLYGGGPTKDHIYPIMLGGCDCIANLQPACRNCNSKGIGADLRNAVKPGWAKEFIARVLFGRCDL